MKAGWKVKKLGDISTIELGKTPLRANKSFWDEELKTSNVWLSIADLLNTEGKVVSDSKEYVSDKGAAISKVVRKGTLLVSFKLTLGRLAFAGRDLFTNEAIAALSIFDEKELSKEFLFYFLHYFDWRKAAENDAKIKGMTLNKAKLKELLVYYPSLTEQKRIVAILDQAFEGIAKARTNAEQNLQNACALFESHLQSVFTQRGEGWVEKKLGEVCDLVNGFAFKSSDVVETSHTQLVRMGNLYGNTLSLDRSPVFYPDAFAQIHRNYLLVKDDLIMSLTGTTGKEDYGYTVKIPNCNHALLMNQRIVKFEILNTKLINRNFLMHYLRSRVFLDKLYLTANGTRQANLSSVVIKTLLIPVCVIENQQSIAETLNAFSEEAKCLEAIYHRKIELLDELKKSLLQQAFAGEL